MDYLCAFDVLCKLKIRLQYQLFIVVYSSSGDSAVHCVSSYIADNYDDTDDGRLLSAILNQL